MKKQVVKDIMVPLERYATIHEDRLLIDRLSFVLGLARLHLELRPTGHVRARVALRHDGDVAAVEIAR